MSTITTMVMEIFKNIADFRISMTNSLWIKAQNIIDYFFLFITSIIFLLVDNQCIDVIPKKVNMTTRLTSVDLVSIRNEGEAGRSDRVPESQHLSDNLLLFIGYSTPKLQSYPTLFFIGKVEALDWSSRTGALTTNHPQRKLSIVPCS